MANSELNKNTRKEYIFERKTDKYKKTTIKKGDTLYNLFGVDWNYIYDLDVNQPFRDLFSDPNEIEPGAVIHMPVYKDGKYFST